MASGPSAPEPASTQAASRPEIGGRYARYVLAVLVLVYIFNFVDRQILSILADEIKADIGVSDAQLGFLYGTVFAVFYAVFGIPLGRFADVWVRKSLISVGLLFWSVMTALSGTARSFLTLGTYRIGVGVGEASATPAAFSLLSDYFSPSQRATVLAIYSSGVYIGAGIGIFLGGWIVDGWSAAFPEGNAPLGIRGWQAAFFAVGLPGILMAIWVWMLREPVRGQSEGITASAPHPHPFRELARELAAVLPPLTLRTLLRAGAGSRGIAINLSFAAGIAALAWLLIGLLGSPEQWIALGVAVYAALSWAQGLALRDPPTFTMIFRSRALMYSCLAFPCIAFVTYGIGFWGAPFFLRVHGVSASEAGTFLGLGAALGGWIGVTLGGTLSDRLKRRHPRARLYLGFATVVLSVPVALGLLTTDNLALAYSLNFVFAIVSPLWIGGAASLVNELVLPRMRGTASAFYILMITFIGLALGPYSMGQLSDALASSGMSSGDALRTSMMFGLSPFALTVLFLWLAARHVEAEETSRMERASAAGEQVAVPSPALSQS